MINKNENLTPHFKLNEFLYSDTAINRGIDNIPTDEHYQNLKHLAQQLEMIRSLLGNKPIIINSAYRCHALNVAVSGVPNSDHTLGLACDFTCPQFGTEEEVAKAIVNSDINFDQIIYEQKLYTEWVHIGFGTRMRREVLSWKQGQGYVTGIRKL